MKVKKMVAVETVVDLAGTPFGDWPKEAVLIARAILVPPSVREEFRRQTPLERRLWLADKVEERVKAREEIEREFGFKV